MLIEDKPHCTIEYDPDVKCVIQTWRGFAGSKAFRASLEKTVEVFKTHDVTSIISNTRDSGVVDEEDAQWVPTKINPILIRNGLKKIAFIMPANVFAQWSIDHFLRKAEKQPLEAMRFDTLEQAQAWIREQG